MMNTFTKSIFLISIPLSICVSGFAQSDEIKVKRFQYGLHAGATYSLVKSREELPANSHTYNGWGYKVGLDFGYKMGKHSIVTSSISLSVNRCGVNHTQSNEANRYEIYPGALDIAALARISLFDKNPSIYLVAGPSIRFPLHLKELNPTTFTTSRGMAIDAGFGLSHRLGRYIIAPEIRYSHGLTNINANPRYRDLRYNCLSIVLNFRV